MSVSKKNIKSKKHYSRINKNKLRRKLNAKQNKTGKRYLTKVHKGGQIKHKCMTIHTITNKSELKDCKKQIKEELANKKKEITIETKKIYEKLLQNISNKTPRWWKFGFGKNTKKNNKVVLNTNKVVLPVNEESGTGVVGPRVGRPTPVRKVAPVETVAPVRKVTQLSIVKKLNTNNKQIKHFWYRDWPDHGAPNLSTDKPRFISFIDNLLDDIHNNPGGTVIHCSAGVGRTGTVFVILKICLEKCKTKPASLGKLLDEIEKVKKQEQEQEPIYENYQKGSLNEPIYGNIQKSFSNEPIYENYFPGNKEVVSYVDITDAITYARKRRNYMVQSFDQMQFICDLFGVKSDESNFSNIGKTEYNKMKLYTINVMCKSHNRYGNILPYEESIVKLGKIGDDICSTYINANYLNHEIKNNENNKFNVADNNFNGTVIATQCPIKNSNVNTLPNFLRMLNDNKITRIVMLTGLEELKEGKKTPKCDDYTSDDDYTSGDKTLFKFENKKGYNTTFGNFTEYTLKEDKTGNLILTDGKLLTEKNLEINKKKLQLSGTTSDYSTTTPPQSPSSPRHPFPINNQGSDNNESF